MELDIPGFYEIDINYVSNDNAPIFAQASFTLKSTPAPGPLGSQPRGSVTHKASDVKISLISPVLLILTLTFMNYPSTKHSTEQTVGGRICHTGFLASATCGPQVGELTKVKQRMVTKPTISTSRFIKNPPLIEGQRPTGGLISAVDEWGLPTEPWTFIVEDTAWFKSNSNNSLQPMRSKRSFWNFFRALN
ncbi:MAG: hypothetical protein Ct9H300mP27_05850 [Chloroflexota bacterium]|nr:MAG: hypothetical protein Ct9H300mP27_05850 [Chloroflexota bacterium]